MFLESERFDSNQKIPENWREGVLRFCEVVGFHFDGQGPEGVFIGSTFEKCSWYWSLFNCAIFVGVTFRGCEFSGVTFASCKFVECIFEDCKFTDDAFGKPCSFNENSWYRCELVRTPKPLGGLR